ncbi:MAG: VTT domain-containing protein [Actinomycetia bacterium]|nr:VTT domain-containing protein [Actinomycetes bacterium]
MLAANLGFLNGVIDWLSEFTDKLGDWAGNWWFLGVIFTIALLDSVIPVVPSETTVIIGGVAVATGTAPYPLVAVIAAGAAGAFIGDNMAFSIGKHWSDAFERRAQRKPKFAAKLTWAREQIAARGGLLLITARFIPGGRTAITIASGITRQSRAWFVRWTFIAALIWATYAAGLARLVGEPFKDDHSKAFWIAFGTALGINVAIEIVRYFRLKRAEREWSKPAV